MSAETYKESANIHLTDGNKHLLLATNRLTWNVSKNWFLGLESMIFIAFNRAIVEQVVVKDLYYKPIAVRVGFRF